MTGPAGERVPAPDPKWSRHARCRGSNTNTFYPHPSDNATAVVARAICASCPVADACLDYALGIGEPHGIWGGTSERQRRKLRRARAKEQSE